MIPTPLRFLLATPAPQHVPAGQWLGYPQAVRNRLTLFPSVVCTSVQHLPHMLVAGAALVVYLVTACLNLMADFELNPTTRNLYATANSTVEVRACLIVYVCARACFSRCCPRAQAAGISRARSVTDATWSL